MSAESVVYVYGFVRDGFDVARAPTGIEDAPVELLGAGEFRALASRLPGADYAAPAIERSTGDLAWLTPRAQAHDLVLTWAQERGGVLPLPMFSMWASDASLAETLRGRQEDLRATFERVRDADEFGLRLHRRDAMLIESVSQLDDDVRRLQDEAAAASPGQRYLLERKLAEQKKGAARRVSQRMARDAFERLASLSRASLARPLAPPAGAAAEMTLVLNGAFLVDRRRAHDFRAAVGALMKDMEPSGIVFDFTGPWPPYHFSGQSPDVAEARS